MARLNLLLRAASILVFSGAHWASAAVQMVPHYSYTVNNDGTSAECLSCHNLVHPVPVCTVRCGFNDPHIIDTPYPPLDRFDEFLPPEYAVRFGIRFSNGMVTCISCHNLLNPGQYHLAISNERSRLCLACHIM